MNTHSPKTGKHRWLVATPLFALCFVLSMGDVFFPATAAITASATYTTDGRTLLDTMSGAQLREGTVLVFSPEWTTLQAGAFRLSGWNGGFQVTLQQGVVTVAALTTPVLISDGMHSTLIPAFMQWKGVSLKTPDDTLQSWYAPRAVQSLPTFFVEDVLRALPASTPVAGIALPAFVSTSDHFLVAAFHPLTRDHARVLTVPTLATDETRILQLLTPIADVLPDALTPLALRQWQDSWVQTVETREGKNLFAAALPLIATQIKRFDALQYPERVETYATAVLDIAAPMENELTADARKTLQAIRTLRTQRRLAAPIADVPVAASSAASSLSSAQRVDVPPEILVEQAAFALANAGFMFTSRTILQPVDGIVHVEGIVFGTAYGDSVLHFRFDPQAGLISGIEKDSQVLPYAITLLQFTEWLRTE